ncbi:TPR repeat-containing protein DDB_G0287407-like [Mytilus trossulus]|uniref:TPR repeat-containing protein DDB_G0287407-like n=1 Tax=Mytilus trossulus TaxID=6551 RepID=UPI003007028E
MGSGSSKKNKETATKSSGNNTSENAKSDTAVKNHESESTKQNEEKKILAEKPDAMPKQTAMAKETKSSEASNQRKLSNGDHLSWMETDLSELMGGLELSDDPCVWEQYVDDLICKRKPEITPEKERRSWKTIRLFVSSTFKDMNNERDYLVKVIFPQLREWCEERKLRLVECDLRWGVPKDADTRETLTTCLSELDRCREENIYPYFLSLVSERFGWVPKIEEIPDDIRARYKWMPGMSVTTSEIMVGGYWGQNRNALFLMRTPDYLDHVKDEKVKSYLTEKNDDHRHSLSTLKTKLRTKYPKQVHDYSCTYEKEAEGKLYLSGFEEMGQRVLQHFKTMLSLQYPTDSLGLSPTLKDVLKLEHETFMFQRSQVLLGREESVQMIHSYIDDTVKEHVPLVLAGFPGSGKSALIAYTVKQCLTNKKYKVFYHFIGATPGSTDLFQILQRFFLEFMPEGTKMPDDLQEMKRYAHTMFKYAAQVAKKEGYQKIVVFLDALNQMDDDGDAHYLVWLPKKLPEGMRIIVSTLEGKCLNSLRDDPDRKTDEKKSIELSVDPLVKSIRKNIVTKILAEYNKRLDDEQLEILTDKPDAGRPLWLTVACEELRVFGEFRKLTQKIRDLPIDMIGLLEVTSRFGLLETELFELLAMQPSIPGAKIVDDLAFEGRLPMAKWALVYVGLRQFLRPCGSSGEGRLDFHHRTMSKAVRKMYLSDQVAQRWWHQRLTEYFDKCTDMERKAEELPYHLECSADKEKLKEVLLSQDMFKEMYKDNSKQQLMKYWRFIGGYQIASQSYYDSLKRFITDNNLTEVLDWAPIQSKTASFLVDIGEYTIADDMLNEVITTLVEKYGKDSKELCEPTYFMVNLLLKKALQYVYGAHPGYRECCVKGLKLSELCVAVNKKYFSKDKQYLGRVLLSCGYFERGTSCLEEAMNMFENINDQQGLAVALYMLGEKNQYHSDLSIPTEMFKKSMGLCSSMFGKFHLNTARCAQLHGQMLWNNWTTNRKPEFLENCLVLYQQEVEILCEIQGDLHPNTVRSREDVIIILQSLGRDEEAKKYQNQQPKEHSAL